jgi:ribosome modulation factor
MLPVPAVLAGEAAAGGYEVNIAELGRLIQTLEDGAEQVRDANKTLAAVGQLEMLGNDALKVEARRFEEKWYPLADDEPDQAPAWSSPGEDQAGDDEDEFHQRLGLDHRRAGVGTANGSRCRGHRSQCPRSAPQIDQHWLGGVRHAPRDQRAHHCRSACH